MCLQQVTSGMDPFLGSNSSYHERERSCDSGVSGMGSNFNLQRGTDEYLSNVEEMDTGINNYFYKDNLHVSDNTNTDSAYLGYFVIKSEMSQVWSIIPSDSRRSRSFDKCDSKHFKTVTN